MAVYDELIFGETLAQPQELEGLGRDCYQLGKCCAFCGQEGLEVMSYRHEGSVFGESQAQLGTWPADMHVCLSSQALVHTLDNAHLTVLHVCTPLQQRKQCQSG